MELSIDSFKYPVTECKVIDIYGSSINVDNKSIKHSLREFSSYVNDLAYAFEISPATYDLQWLFIQDKSGKDYYCCVSTTGIKVYDTMPHSLLTLLLSVE